MAGFYDVGKLVATLGLNTMPFMASAKGATSAIAKLNNQMMMVGRTMTRFVTLPMVLSGAGAVKMQKNYEKSLTKIIGLVGVARDTVEDWSMAIKEMAPSVGKGPEELADAMYFIASAGIRGSKALEVLEQSAKASAVGLGEVKVIADLVTSALNAYKGTGLTAAKATDILVASVREGKAEADELAGAMGKVLPIASSFGVTFDQVGAAFAAMTRTGTNAQIAATQLKAILSALASPSEQSADNLGLFEKKAEDLRKTIAERGLMDGLLELRDAVNNDKAAFAGVFPNIRALMGVLDLLGANMNDNVRIFESLKNSTGSLKDAFLEVQDTTQFKLDKAMASLGVTAIEFGEILKGPVVNALSVVTGKLKMVSDRMQEMDAAHKQATLSMIAFGAAAGPVFLVLTRLFTLIAANPIAGLALALGAGVAAFAKYRSVLKSVTAEQIRESKVSKQVAKLTDERKKKASDLLKVAADETQSMEDRKDAMAALNQLSPTYFGHLTAEAAATDMARVALKYYIKEMELKARLESGLGQQMLGEAQEASAKRNRKLVSMIRDKWQGAAIFVTGVLGGMNAQLAVENKILEARKKNDEYIESQFEAANQQLELEKERESEMEKLLNAYEAEVEAIKAAIAAEKLLNDISPGRVRTKKEIWELEKDIKYQQQQVTAASKENIAAEMDKLRALENQLQFYQAMTNAINPILRLESEIAKLKILAKDADKADLTELHEQIRANERLLMIEKQKLGAQGEETKLRNRLSLLQFDAAELSGKELINNLENQRAIEDQIRLIDLKIGGLGESEMLDERILRLQRQITDSKGDERKQLLWVLQGLYLQRDLMDDINHLRDPVGFETIPGTKAFRQYHEERIALAYEFMAKELAMVEGNEAAKQVIRDKYEQEIFSSQQAIRQMHMDNWNTYAQAATTALSTITDILERQKQKELKAVEDNTEAQEAIELKYMQKKKKWAIAQALINGALAITNMIGNVPLSVLNPATWIGIGVAAAATAAQVALIAGQSFAKGGIAYGETYAKIGDYPGARANPEVVSPLNKLKTMIKDSTGDMHFGKVVFEIEGRKLRGVLEKEAIYKGSY